MNLLGSFLFKKKKKVIKISTLCFKKYTLPKKPPKPEEINDCDRTGYTDTKQRERKKIFCKIFSYFS